MSHFIVNIILPQNEVSTKKIEEMLAPYDANKETEPYIAYYRRHAGKLYAKELKHLREIINLKNENINLKTCKELYEKIRKMTVEQYYDYHFEGESRDKNDNILSTYNPVTKWDWCQIGGRWAGWLLNLPPRKAARLKNNCCPIEHALKEKKIPFALITPEGNWIERGKMGWWAMITGEMSEGKWEKTVLDCYKKYPEHMVVQIDCHI